MQQIHPHQMQGIWFTCSNFNQTTSQKKFNESFSQ